MKVVFIFLFQITTFLQEIEVSWSCPDLQLNNGSVRYKSRNRVVFFCTPPFIRYGARVSKCTGGKWNNSPPVCIAPGCPPVPTNEHRDVDFTHDDAVVLYSCLDPYVLVGNAQAFCDGTNWSTPAPECKSPEDVGQCDFEDGEFCGWMQDDNDDFDWSRQSGETNTGRTGPDYDHTLGPNQHDGHYIYMESSSPRMPGHVARLLSPSYSPVKSGQCFEFWYHMLGPGGENQVGSLDVSIRFNASQLKKDGKTEDVLLFSIAGNQGTKWNRGYIYIEKTNITFQIVLTATRRKSYLSDIAIDDVGFYPCQESTTSPETLTTAIERETTTYVPPGTTTAMTTTGETSTALTTEETVNTDASGETTVELNTKQRITTKNTRETTATFSTTRKESTEYTDIALEHTSATTKQPILSSSTEEFKESSSVLITHQFNVTTINGTSAYPDIISITESAITNISNDTEGRGLLHFADLSSVSTTNMNGREALINPIGVLHTPTFVVALCVGIGIVVIGALIIAFIVHRMKYHTKHYRGEDFETMHVATYRKQSTDVLIN